MVCTVQDILPMHRGTSGYTEYDLDERLIEYVKADFKTRKHYMIGHIHSHHSMAVFFSGTDNGELVDNADNHNIYLSLIVNNFMDMTAKIAFSAHAHHDPIAVPYMAKDENGVAYKIENGSFVIDKKKVYSYSCEVSAPVYNPKVPEEFVNNFKKIDAYLAKKTAAQKVVINNQKKLALTNNVKKIEKEQEIDMPHVSDRMASYYTSAEFNTLRPKVSIEDKFIMALINFSNVPEEEDSVDTLLEVLEEYELTPHQVSESISEYYATVYASFFPDRSVEEFIVDTEYVISVFEEYVTVFPIIEASITMLKDMNNKVASHAG